MHADEAWHCPSNMCGCAHFYGDGHTTGLILVCVQAFVQVAFVWTSLPFTCHACYPTFLADRPVTIISLGIKTYICYHLHGFAVSSCAPLQTTFGENDYLETIQHIDHASCFKFAALELIQAGQILAVSSVETCQVIIGSAHTPPLVIKWHLYLVTILVRRSDILGRATN